jgi:hypothetical protein
MKVVGYAAWNSNEAAANEPTPSAIHLGMAWRTAYQACPRGTIIAFDNCIRRYHC